MKKAILLLHGWLTDIKDFDAIIPYLEENYDHIERLAYPGHYDGSDYSEFNAEDTFKIVEDSFKRLIEEYDVVDVIGYSMGAAFGSYLGSKYCFNRLVLISPANKYFNIKYPFSKLKHSLAMLYQMNKLIFSHNQETKDRIKERLSTALSDDYSSMLYVKDKILRKFFRKAYNHFKEVITKLNNEVTSIKIPTMILWGELDQLVPKESATYVYSLCTNKYSKLKLYPDLSHYMLLSVGNKELIDDIKDFLSQPQVSEDSKLIEKIS